MRRTLHQHWLLGVALALLLALLLARPAVAAQLESGEVYHLAAGQVVDDDLYVAAREIVIDGTVNGDLIAAGQTVQVNGSVTGDALLAGAQITIGGSVGDDARVAGAVVE